MTKRYIFVILQNWEPACLTTGSGRYQTCALGPKILPQNGQISKDIINAKILSLYKALKCEDSGFPPALLSFDWVLCRDGSYCSETKKLTLTEVVTAEPMIA